MDVSEQRKRRLSNLDQSYRHPRFISPPLLLSSEIDQGDDQRRSIDGYVATFPFVEIFISSFFSSFFFYPSLVDDPLFFFLLLIFPPICSRAVPSNAANPRRPPNSYAFSSDFNPSRALLRKSSPTRSPSYPPELTSSITPVVGSLCSTNLSSPLSSSIFRHDFFFLFSL